MGAKSKLYGKVFLTIAIPYGLLFGLYLAVVSGQGVASGVLGALLSGLLFGLAMATILGTMHIASVRRRGREGPADFSVKQRQQLRLALPPIKAFERAVQAVTALPATVTSSDSESGHIEAKVGMSWRSWGETVTIVVQPQGSSSSSVCIESRPRLRITVVDYGKNRQNVERIVGALTAGGGS
ncbi:DUF1499 domain-containing protein [Streptomyces sp. DT203]|uniref:DUF1499 domain-containing protein n=1 Tax=Streptomyces sp. DT203 TaxID=3393424 RepID=UPI003CF496A0